MRTANTDVVIAIDTDLKKRSRYWPFECSSAMRRKLFPAGIVRKGATSATSATARIRSVLTQVSAEDRGEGQQEARGDQHARWGPDRQPEHLEGHSLAEHASPEGRGELGELAGHAGLGFRGREMAEPDAELRYVVERRDEEDPEERDPWEQHEKDGEARARRFADRGAARAAPPRPEATLFRGAH